MKHTMAYTLFFLLVLVAYQGSYSQMSVWAVDPDSIGTTSAVLRAYVNPRGHTVRVEFLGASTTGVIDAGIFSGTSLIEVRCRTTGLTPDGYYVYRVRTTDVTTFETVTNDDHRDFRTNQDSLQWGFLTHLDWFVGGNLGFRNEVSFGLHTRATYCIDGELGEYQVPPEPPQGVPDKRFIDPHGFNGNCMDQGVYPDMRPYQSSTQVDTYKVRLTPGDLGYPMRIVWSDVNIRYSGSVVLRYVNGDGFVYIDMKATNSLDVNEQTDFLIVASGPINPNRPTSVPQGTSLPDVFSLGQNYPNPFNPSTVINYNVPINVHVTLKVYDVLGREVMTLVNGIVEAGNHQSILNAANLASGLYFYQLQAGSYSSIKKLILLK